LQGATLNLIIFKVSVYYDRLKRLKKRNNDYYIQNSHRSHESQGCKTLDDTVEDERNKGKIRKGLSS
jgi:hypothetical protein